MSSRYLRNMYFLGRTIFYKTIYRCRGRHFPTVSFGAKIQGGKKIWCIGHGSLQWVASPQETRHFIKAVIYGKGRMVHEDIQKSSMQHTHWPLGVMAFFCNFWEITCNWYTFDSGNRLLDNKQAGLKYL